MKSIIITAGIKLVVTAILLVLVGLSACRKERVQPQPSIGYGRIEIALNDNYLPASKVDSALAIWEKDGMKQVIKLQRLGNTFWSSLTDLRTAGTGMLTVQLFTTTTVADRPLQWEKRFTQVLERSTSLQLTAPTGFADPSWNPRMISINDIAGESATFIVALRPGDPYFELKNIDISISKHILIQRDFLRDDISHVVVSQQWVGNTGSLDASGSVINREHFQALPVMLGNNAWNKYLIKVQFYTRLNPNYIYESEYILDRP